jgi:hypothetical protein
LSSSARATASSDFEKLAAALLDFAGFVGSQPLEAHEVIEVALPDALALTNGPVEEGLGEGGLVAFVVAAQPVAIHVDHDIALELTAEGHGKADDLGDGFGVLAVDMENGALEHLGNGRGVGRGAGLLRIGGEADLVVQNDVQGAADGVGVELGEIERFLNHALADECGVAMNQQAHAVVAVARAILLGAHTSFSDGIDEFKMAGVEAERQMHLPARGRHVFVAVTHVVLDVAPADVQFGIGVFEFTENAAGGLAHDIAEDVEAAAVRHRQDDFGSVRLARRLDGEVEQGNQALGAFEREALRADELLLNEFLEDRGAGQLLENTNLLSPCEFQPVFALLHTAHQPFLDGEVVDVHVLHADGAAIRVAQAFDQAPHRQAGRSIDRLGGDGAVEVGFLDAVELGLEFGHRGAGPPERVDFRLKMAADPVGAHHLVDAMLEDRILGGRVDL